MKELNAEQVQIESVSVLETIRQARSERPYTAYAGLDVHKDTVAVAVTWPGRDKPEYLGERSSTAARRWRS